MARRLLLLSTSTVHGSDYLDYCAADLQAFFGQPATVVFVPFARAGGISHDEYTSRARARFAAMGLNLESLHEMEHPVRAVEQAEAMFIGGGNTFLLLDRLYEHKLLEPIRERAHEGMLYSGTSAGANVAGLTIGTTNDMPIVYPPSFDALGLIPVNINPHYLDADPESTHMGETRETRITEFHLRNAQPVIGLREGAGLSVSHNTMRLVGTAGAKLFRRGELPVEVAAGEDVSSIL